MVLVKDRIINQESMVLGFTAQHSLPFTLVPQLICLTKELAKDRQALQKTVQWIGQVLLIK